MPRFTVQTEREGRFGLVKRSEPLQLERDREEGFTHSIDIVFIKHDLLGCLRITSEGPYPIKVVTDEIRNSIGMPIYPAEIRVLTSEHPAMIARGHKVTVFPSAGSGKTERLKVTFKMN